MGKEKFNQRIPCEPKPSPFHSQARFIWGIHLLRGPLGASVPKTALRWGLLQQSQKVSFSRDEELTHTRQLFLPIPPTLTEQRSWTAWPLGHQKVGSTLHQEPSDPNEIIPDLTNMLWSQPTWTHCPQVWAPLSHTSTGSAVVTKIADSKEPTERWGLERRQ